MPNPQKPEDRFNYRYTVLTDAADAIENELKGKYPYKAKRLFVRYFKGKKLKMTWRRRESLVKEL